MDKDQINDSEVLNDTPSRGLFNVFYISPGTAKVNLWFRTQRSKSESRIQTIDLIVVSQPNHGVTSRRNDDDADAVKMI